MRRIVLLTLLVLLPAAALAQRRGGIAFARGAPAPAFARGNFTPNRARNPYAYGYGYAYLPSYAYDSPYAYTGSAYDSSGQPVYVQPQPVFFVPPQPPEPPREARPVLTDYKFPAAAASASEPQTFAIVLKDGSTLDATMIVAADSGAVLQFVSPDERHLRISMLDVDRDATLKLNRARNLTLHLP